jgi:hypothetical protein
MFLFYQSQSQSLTVSVTVEIFDKLTSDGKISGNFPYDVRASFFTCFFSVISMFREIFTVLSMFYSIICVSGNLPEIFITKTDMQR